MVALIQVDVAGEAGGTPGVSREFVYSKIDTAPPLVTLTIPGGGITQYFWEFLAIPTGSTSTLTGPTTANPTFTPTATIDGTYLVQCTINGGADFGRVCLAFSSQNLAIRKPAPGEEDEFSDTRGWEPAMEKVIDYVDTGAGVVSGRKRAVIDYVDATAVPPTEVLGDRYILDDTGAPHANWDGAAQLDIVQFDGTSWIAETPVEGWTTYADLLDADAVFVDDGAPLWEWRPSGTYTLDEGYNQFGASAATVVIDNAESQGDLTFQPAGDFSFNVDLANVTNTSDGFQVNNGTDYFRFIRTAANKIAVETALDTYAITADAHSTVSTTGAARLSLTAGDSLNLSSGTEMDLSPTGLLDINAGANMDIDVTGTFDMLSSSTMSIDATGNSNVSATSGNLTLSTITTGNLIFTAADGITTGSSFLSTIVDNSNYVAASFTQNDVTNAVNCIEATGAYVHASLTTWLAAPQGATIEASQTGAGVTPAMHIIYDGAGFPVIFSGAGLTLGTATIDENNNVYSFAHTTQASTIRASLQAVAATAAGNTSTDNLEALVQATRDIATAGDADATLWGKIDNVGASGAAKSTVKATNTGTGNATVAILASATGAGTALIDADADVMTLDLTSTLTIQSVGASLWGNDTGDLQLQTSTSGDLRFVSVEELYISAGVNMDMDITGTFTADFTDTSNITLTANDAGDVSLSILVTNAGAGDGTLVLNADQAVRVGAGAPGNATGTNDFYITGKLEVDGTAYLDGAVEMRGHVWLNTNVYIRNDAAFGGVIFRNSMQTADTMQWLTGDTSHYILVCDFADNAFDFQHPNQTNPTIFGHSANQSTTEWWSLTHNVTDHVKGIGSGSHVTNHSAPTEIADEGSFSLPTSSAGWGTFLAGDGEEVHKVHWNAAGTVTAIYGTANAVLTDTDAKFCIITGADPVVVKNRLGAAKKITFDYHYTTP